MMTSRRKFLIVAVVCTLGLAAAFSGVTITLALLSISRVYLVLLGAAAGVAVYIAHRRRSAGGLALAGSALFGLMHVPVMSGRFESIMGTASLDALWWWVTLVHTALVGALVSVLSIFLCRYGRTTTSS